MYGERACTTSTVRTSTNRASDNLAKKRPNKLLSVVCFFRLLLLLLVRSPLPHSPSDCLCLFVRRSFSFYFFSVILHYSMFREKRRPRIENNYVFSYCVCQNYSHSTCTRNTALTSVNNKKPQKCVRKYCFDFSVFPLLRSVPFCHSLAIELDLIIIIICVLALLWAVTTENTTQH